MPSQNCINELNRVQAFIQRWQAAPATPAGEKEMLRQEAEQAIREYHQSGCASERGGRRKRTAKKARALRKKTRGRKH
jgi:hypothetical protein